ncbi:hypothetical protein Leryth_027307 [Lithospermum erythrorhizon]|nr:hypothetical protein Leryth_027307 [Lithospermum erythrorhizon]
MASHSNINYSSDESVLRLISGCPSLEQLNISRDVFDEIHVSSPKAADIDSHCQRVVQLIQIVHNVSHLWISGDTLEERCTPGSL